MPGSYGGSLSSRKYTAKPGALTRYHHFLLFESQRASIRIYICHYGVARAERSAQELQRQRSLNQPLDRPPHRPCAVGRIISFRHDQIDSRLCELQFQTSLTEHSDYPFELDLNDPLQILPAQSIKYDDVIDSVQKFWPESGAQSVQNALSGLFVVDAAAVDREADVRLLDRP